MKKIDQSEPHESNRAEVGGGSCRARGFWRSRSGLGLLMAVGFGQACGEAPAGPVQDVILIVADTLRADASQGAAASKSLGIGRLAADGVSFQQAFSHAPMTLPAHTSLFSSRAPSFTGVTNNWQVVPEELPLLAGWLQEHGYATQAVLSLGTLNPHEGKPGLDRGFDRYDLDYWHMDTAPEALERMKSALDRIDRSKPLFLFAHFSDPHSPYNAHGTENTTADILLDGKRIATVSTSDMTQWSHDEVLPAGEHTLEIRSEKPFNLKAFEWRLDGRYATPTWEKGAISVRSEGAFLRCQFPEEGKSSIRLWIAESLDSARIRKHYRGEVVFLDGYIAQFLEELDRHDLYEDSLILFTSDHGEALGEHGLIGQHVQNLHDEMLHVPLIIKLPAGHPAHVRIAQYQGDVVGHQDVVPTILALLELPPLPGQQGQSLFLGPTAEVLSQTHKPEATRSFLGLRNGKHKLIYDLAAESYQMYELSSDPGEQHDVFEPRKSELPGHWVSTLELLGKAATGEINLGDMDPELVKKLQALGYAGDDEENTESRTPGEEATGAQE